MSNTMVTPIGANASPLKALGQFFFAKAFKKIRHPKLSLGLALAMWMLFATDSAFAGWFTNIVAFIGIAAAVVAFFAVAPAVITVAVYVAYAAVAVLVVAVAVEVYGIASIYTSSLPAQPAIAANPEAADPLPISGVLAPIPVPGNGADALVNAVNDAVAVANTISNHALNGTGNVLLDLAAFNAALAPAGAAYDSAMLGLGFPVLDIAQVDIDNAVADIALNGLPVSLKDALLDMGLTPANVQVFSDNLLAPDTNLAVPSVSVKQVLAAAANLQVVPEPGSLLLISTGLLALFGSGLPRRTKDRRVLGL